MRPGRRVAERSSGPTTQEQHDRERNDLREPAVGEVGILPLPEPATDEPLPVEPYEMPEPVDRTVVIVSAELVTSMAWTADGTLVLLPHYRLTDADGTWWWVVAVEDAYVQR